MLKPFVLLGLAAFASGCAAALPFTTSFLSPPSAGALEIHHQTDVRIEQGNFFVVRTNVVGQHKGFALLGVVTIVPARFNTAMNRLYAGASVETGKPQTLINLVMEKSSTYLILFSIPRITVRGDLVEFLPVSRPPEILPRIGAN